MITNSTLGKIIKHPLLAGSLVMVLGSNLHNFGQFVYHFLTGRLLGRVQYGDLASVISILGLISIVQLSFGLTIVKYISSAKEKGIVSNFVNWVHTWSLWLGIVISVLLLLLSPFVIKFLNIAYPEIVYLLIPVLFLSVLLNSYRSILQALLSFNKYALSLIVEVGIKLIFAIILISLGYKLFGAMLALVVGALCAFILTRFSLSTYFKEGKGEMPKISPLVRYSFPVFIQGLALTSMYSTDLILVKHFFSPEDAGVYASLAILGRVVFFGSSPVTNVMFPLIARRHSHGKPYHSILYLSMFFIFAISAPIIFLYMFFPQVPIGILYGNEFLAGSPLLWWFGVFMGLLAFAMLFIQFYLSIGKTRIVSLFAISALLQVVLIWFVHPSLLAVIQMSVISVSLLLLGFLIYFPYHDKKNGQKTTIGYCSGLQT